MLSKFSSATATLALTSASCEAFLVPAFTPQGSSTSTVTGMRSSRRSSVSMEVSAKPEVGEADTINSSDNPLSSYPGPVIPRVGGAMPEKRPGWFRVPAPGGKDSKVSISSIRVQQQYNSLCSFHEKGHRASSVERRACRVLET